ncbi:MAG: hypothetical protein WDN00_18085 [Limisphaerales bacterium]
MNESEMTLGTDYTTDVNPAGWLVSEKMNGCRAYWDGSQFWTRGGNVISAPAWFMEGLPTSHLDGEIWAGRESFEEARLAVQFGRWTRRCRFVAFDAPAFQGTWARRMRGAEHIWRDVVKFEPVKSRAGLMKRLREVKNWGGEGLMIRNSETTGYETGKTSNLLKVKVAF